eukprot:4433991-Pyramimonas_sp.AAC.2
MDDSTPPQPVGALLTTGGVATYGTGPFTCVYQDQPDVSTEETLFHADVRIALFIPFGYTHQGRYISGGSEPLDFSLPYVDHQVVITIRVRVCYI